MHLLLLMSLLAGAAPAAGRTWYVRPDGGTADQCNGRADAPYPGKGGNQPCAFSNPYFLWTNDISQKRPMEKPVWKIAGGDTVLIKNGDYRMGFKTPAADGWWNYQGCRGNNHGCSNPPIPAGTDEAPTRIVGEGWQTGCRVKPILRGAGGVSAVLDLRNSNHLDVECLEFTDNDQCRLMTMRNEPHACVNYQSDHAYWALQTNENTHHLVLRNLFIHGMSSAGILGNVGGDVSAENLYLRGNGNFGWDFDPGGGAISKGPLTIRNTVVEWSACVERFPLADPPILACYDQAGANANGDGLGFVDFEGDLTIDHTIVRYNQQDGLDALYVKSGQNLTVTNSQFYANSGQQVKTGGATNTVIRNNIIIGNCERQREGVPGVTAENYNELEKGFCRGEDNVAMMFRAGTNVHFENNSITTYAPTGFNIQCRTVSDSFTSAGRKGWDGTTDGSLAPDGNRRSFPLTSPVDRIGPTGAIFVYPAGKKQRIPKRAGKVGETMCYGHPCQFFWDPGKNTLTQAADDPPVQAGDELRVEYAYANACSTGSLSFQNNVIRGYPRPSTRRDAGGFFQAIWPDKLNEIWRNNFYCGMPNVLGRPGETVSRTCPGNWFVREPASLTSQSVLDTLDMHLAPGGPLAQKAVGAFAGTKPAK